MALSAIAMPCYSAHTRHALWQGSENFFLHIFFAGLQVVGGARWWGLRQSTTHTLCRKPLCRCTLHAVRVNAAPRGIVVRFLSNMLVWQNNCPLNNFFLLQQWHCVTLKLWQNWLWYIEIKNTRCSMVQKIWQVQYFVKSEISWHWSSSHRGSIVLQNSEYK